MCDVQVVCPETKLPLEEVPLQIAEQSIADGSSLEARLNRQPAPVGPTSRVLMRSDRRAAYPISNGIPVLLGPEVLRPSHEAEEIDLSDPRYEEAYLEMDFYNSVAIEQANHVESSTAAKALRHVPQLLQHQIASFPEPKFAWLDATFDLTAEYEAYRYVAPLKGKRVMQLGGSGLLAVKFLLAGCKEAWLISPMVGELIFAQRLAEHFGVAEQFHCAAGVGEAIPVGDRSFDVVISGGCLHHMDAEQAFKEVARVLADGGQFTAIDPWRAPLYGIGTRLLGKREQPIVGKRDVGVYCRPMTTDRVLPLSDTFADAQVQLHGSLTRYPLLALCKLGLSVPKRWMWRISVADDRFSSYIPNLRSAGSSMVILARKSEKPHRLALTKAAKRASSASGEAAAILNAGPTANPAVAPIGPQEHS